jgi:hypothetical protein
MGGIDGVNRVDLDQWPYAEWSRLPAPQIHLGTQSVKVPLVPESVAVPLPCNVEWDPAPHLDDWSGERTD